MDTLHTVYSIIYNNLGIVIIALASLIQISPLKINPWMWLFKVIQKNIMGDMPERINKVEDTIVEMGKRMDESHVSSMRWEILRFANTVRNGTNHAKEEWDHAIEQITAYDTMCERLNIENGVIQEESKYLRDRYQEHLRNNDFLKE